MVRETQSNRKLIRKQDRQLKKQKKAQHFTSQYSNKSHNHNNHSQQQPIKSRNNTKSTPKQHTKEKTKAKHHRQVEEEELEDQQFQEYEGEGGLLEMEGDDDFEGFHEEGGAEYGVEEDEEEYEEGEGDEEEGYQEQEYGGGGMEVEQNEDDELINYYQSKLNKAGSKNYQNLSLKQNGFDKDFFSFLDDISHKVKKGKKEVSSKVDKKEKEKKKVKKNKHQQEQKQDEEMDNQLYPQQSHKLRVDLAPLPQTQQQKQQEQILRKSLNSLLNKVSDGNILKIFRQINALFLNNARSKVFSCFSDLFLKSTVQNPRIQSHILAANIALACGLHHLYDNQFFAPLVLNLVGRFDLLQNTPETVEKIEDQLEVNPVLEKKKNCLKIFCYMYMLGSLTIDFIKEFFFEFTGNIDHSNIQLLYLLVTTVGAKIRSDDPKVLKDIIEYIQEQIGESKNQGYQQNNKVKFILHELNELKLNKKCLVDPDQRFNFLLTFIKRNIIQENSLVAKIFVLTLGETRQKDKSTGFWWEHNVGDGRMEEESEMEEGKNEELNQENKYLEDLARQQKMVTEKKKKIFVAIMKSEDYIEATENILMLKIKNQSEIAEVIVEICSQEKTFNLFYVYLANKLIQCSIRFKNSFKFALWNHHPQFQNYTFRKISNLAKFTSRLIICSPQCSLAFLKNLGDLTSLDKFNQIFLMIFLQQFFQNVALERLNQLITKIRVGDNNKDFKRNLEEYLEEDYYKYCKEGKKGYTDKVKIAIRLLKIEERGRGEDREGGSDRD